MSAPSPAPGPLTSPLLVFGAHPDDIEFGAGGIVANESASGRLVHFVVGSRGEAATSGTPEQREDEARQAAGLLGATVEFVDLGGDAHFQDLLAHRLTLAAIIRRVRPGLILVPTVERDQHPDHAVLGRLVRDAARLARYGGVKELVDQPAQAVGAVLHYAITPEAEPRDMLPVLIDISARLEVWRAAMGAHGSQAATRNYVDLQVARARVWGLRAGVEYAQAVWPAEPVVLPDLAGLSGTARRF